MIDLLVELPHKEWVIWQHKLSLSLKKKKDQLINTHLRIFTLLENQLLLKHKTVLKVVPTIFTTIQQMIWRSKKLKKFGLKVKIDKLLKKEELKKWSNQSSNGVMQELEWNWKFSAKKNIYMLVVPLKLEILLDKTGKLKTSTLRATLF